MVDKTDFIRYLMEQKNVMLRSDSADQAFFGLNEAVVHVPTLAEAYQEHRDQKRIQKAGITWKLSDDRESWIISITTSWQYRRDRSEEETKIVSADEVLQQLRILAAIASAQPQVNSKRRRSKTETYTPTGKAGRTH